MESQTLYRVKKEDLPNWKIVGEMFPAYDPLYCKLIPEKRKPENGSAWNCLSVILQNLLKPVRNLFRQRRDEFPACGFG